MIKSHDQLHKNRSSFNSPLHCSGQQSQNERLLHHQVSVARHKHHTIPQAAPPTKLHPLFKQRSPSHLSWYVFEVVASLFLHLWQVNPFVGLLFDVDDVFDEMLDVEKSAEVGIGLGHGKKFLGLDD